MKTYIQYNNYKSVCNIISKNLLLVWLKTGKPKIIIQIFEVYCP